MATKKEVTDKLTAMKPGEDVLVIKKGPNEFDMVTLHWLDVPGKKAPVVEVGK
jgi:hypothetical protein